MKIGLFTDAHYCKSEVLGGSRYALASFEKTKASMEHFKREGVDIVFCLGDLTDNDLNDTYLDVAENFKAIMSLIYSYDIPFYLVPGNHDYHIMKGDDIEKIGGIRLPPYTVSTNKYDFIVLDANFRESMERFDSAGVVWDDSNLPQYQIDFLEKELSSSDRKCVVLVHENLDPSVDKRHIIKNADKIRDIISKSGKVCMVLQGHYHPGNTNIIDDIPYITLPAMCESSDDYFRIIELN